MMVILLLALCLGVASPASDAPLAPFQGELLDAAFTAVSGMPAHPHAKNRSRAQEAVVVACLELDQARRALGYAELIDGWRRGTACAEVALHLARRGDAAAAERTLALAGAAAEEAARTEEPAGGLADDGAGQAWRVDRIRAKIAVTRIALGQLEEAERIAAGVTESELEELLAERAALDGAGAAGARIAELDAAAAAGGFERLRNALGACARLCARPDADAELRARLASRIRASWKGVPLDVRIGLLEELAEAELGRGEEDAALALVDEAQRLFEEATWIVEDRLPIAARLAALRHRAGDPAKAREDADAALALFLAQRERVVDIFRADALRPLAECYAAMGAPATALAVYRQAVDEGARNPNSRPRAEDLAQTCCSMAMSGIEPDAALRARLDGIRGGLGPPW